MSVRLSRTYGFNPGFGFQTTNATGGTATIYTCPLSAPIVGAGKNAPSFFTGDSIALLRVKTTDRIDFIDIYNDSGIQLNFTLFFAYFTREGRFKFPKYSSNDNIFLDCYYSLACAKLSRNLEGNKGFISMDVGCERLWHSIIDNSENSSGFIFSHASRDPNEKLFIRPQFEPNILSIMEKTLSESAGVPLDNNKNGLSDMDIIDADAAIFCKLASEGDIEREISQNVLSKIMFRIGIINTDISARNAEEEYVKSWDSIKVQGIFEGDGVTLNYNP